MLADMKLNDYLCIILITTNKQNKIMNTNILKTAKRNVFHDIMIDFGLDSKDFEMLKDRHEDEFYGLSFRQAKKLIINDIFTNKKEVEKYLKNIEFDYNNEIKQPCLGKAYLKEARELMEFIKAFINNMK